MNGTVSAGERQSESAGGGSRREYPARNITRELLPESAVARVCAAGILPLARSHILYVK